MVHSCFVEVREAAKRWTFCLAEVAVGHRVADGRDLASLGRCRRCATWRLVWLLPDPVRTAQIGDHRLGALDHRGAGAEEHEVGAGGLTTEPRLMT